MNTPLKLSLAPIAYYWSKEDTLRFYVEAMEWPVDVVYLGEVVCSRRHLMKLDDWLAVARELKSAGKEVGFSSLTLIDNEADRRNMHRIVDTASAEGFGIEANDFSAVRAMQGKAFIAGPHLNVYHADTLQWLQQLGACRFTPPIELSRDDLNAIQAQRPENMQTEVQVWGRMALAFSARCFTARHHHLRKDNCEFTCQQYPDGLPLATRENTDFLNINGIQTQSSTCLDLSAQIPELVAMGVDILRLQPQSQNMENIVLAFDTARKQNTPHNIQSISAQFLPLNAQASNGYWLGQSGMQWSENMSEQLK
jgi:collagenase-like PrtC family protease